MNVLCMLYSNLFNLCVFGVVDIEGGKVIMWGWVELVWVVGFGFIGILGGFFILYYL